MHTLGVRAEIQGCSNVDPRRMQDYKEDALLASAAAGALAALLQLPQPLAVSASARRSGSLALPPEMLWQSTVDAVRCISPVFSSSLHSHSVHSVQSPLVGTPLLCPNKP